MFSLALRTLAEGSAAGLGSSTKDVTFFAAVFTERSPRGGPLGGLLEAPFGGPPGPRPGGPLEGPPDDGGFAALFGGPPGPRPAGRPVGPPRAGAVRC